jgi:hypothetical protein
VRYAVAVTWAMPIIYIGNIFYQSMIANHKSDSIKNLIYWAGGLFAVSLMYILFVGILCMYFVKVPFFANGKDFMRLWGWIVGWYIVYSLIAFPASAVMQKNFSPIQIYRLALYTFFTLIFFGICLYIGYWYFRQQINDGSVLMIVFISTIFSFIAVIPKITFTYNYLRHEFK